MLQRVVERGEGDDGGAVLVVVEHRDVEDLVEALLDLERAGRGDVLEVDAAEASARARYEVSIELVAGPWC